MSNYCRNYVEFQPNYCRLFQDEMADNTATNNTKQAFTHRL